MERVRELMIPQLEKVKFGEGLSKEAQGETQGAVDQTVLFESDCKERFWQWINPEGVIQ